MLELQNLYGEADYVKEKAEKKMSSNTNNPSQSLHAPLAERCKHLIPAPVLTFREEWEETDARGWRGDVKY